MVGGLPIVVGVPRTLSYYTYYPLWKTFLEHLGAKVVLSRPTNKEILEWGVRETVNDACIPIKLFHGHVIDLKDRVDYLFIPRLESADGRAAFCPKFLGLPDMVRYSGLKLPPIIDCSFRVRRVPGGVFHFLSAVAARLGRVNPLRVVRAALVALTTQRTYIRLLERGLHAQQALKMIEQAAGDRETILSSAETENSPSALSVALLGYPYVIHDPFISANLYARLQEMGVRVFTIEQVPAGQWRRLSRLLPQNFFWHYSNLVSWATLYLLGHGEHAALDGIIHVTAFGCGPDAMVDKFVELEAKKAGLPFMTLTIDEHTGEVGVQTRLEAFVDMLLARAERDGREGD